MRVWCVYALCFSCCPPIKVELGFKEARPWPEIVKFQFWPSFNVLQQRKVAYGTLFQKARRRLQGRKLRAQLPTQLGLDRIKTALCSSVA
ncbi:hypothetical protein PIB30_080028, partial [Stylosanthes scabra]|nr:hypothetical protein [Stylosanthes scabra]